MQKRCTLKPALPNNNAYFYRLRDPALRTSKPGGLGSPECGSKTQHQSLRRIPLLTRSP